MSRSYKKIPIIKDKNKGMKELANRRIRRGAEELSNGKSYRKVSETYDICDFSIRRTSESHKEGIMQEIKRALNGEDIHLSPLYNGSDELTLEDFEKMTYEEIEKIIDINIRRDSYYRK